MSTTASSRPRRSRFALLLFGVAAGLVAFELAAQTVAYVIWHTERQSPSTATGTSAVLCVGDSNTFGMGASSAEYSYPARLQRRLDRAQPGRWRVVNGGRPGRNSEELVRALPLQLQRYRPRLVYVLVGFNDGWSNAAAVTDALTVDADAFPLRWRTGRLLALAARWWSAVSDDGPAREPLTAGDWHDRERRLALSLAADGCCTINGTDAFWEQRGEQLVFTMENGARWPVTWRRKAERLILARAGQPIFDGAPGRAPAGDGAPRQAIFFAAPPPMPSSDPRFEAEFAKACAQLRTDPTDAALWKRLAAFELDAHHLQQLEHVLRDAISTTTDAPPRARLLRGLCSVPGKPLDDRLRWALEAATLDGDGTAVVRLLALASPPVDRARFDALVTEVADASGRAALAQLFDRRPPPHGPGDVSVLAHNLRRAVQLCRDGGAECVLLDYPQVVPAVRATADGLAEELGLGRVAVRAAFEQALATAKPTDLFVADGHCSDAGYAVLAEAVWQDARRRLAVPDDGPR